MNRVRSFVCAASLALLAWAQPAAVAFPPPNADVTVGALTGDATGGHPQSYGVSGGIAAYAVGTTSCNVGTEPLLWIDNAANQHPVISQNLFRLKTVDGSTRFEQIGQSWLKHGFCALQQSLCQSCNPYGNCCCDHLGVGCSDPYTASRNGQSSNLGPKYEVNPANGTFIEPHGLPSASTNSIIRGRLQALTGDVNPTLNTGALYWVEGMYLANDDATAGNDLNNASYRRVILQNNASFSMQWPSPAEPTFRQEPAINAWVANDSGVQKANIDIAGDGRMILAWKVSALGGDSYHYEYALYNMNSDRAAGSFSVPLNASTCATVMVSHDSFHDVFYHSGEIQQGTDWVSTPSNASVDWAVVQTPGQNPNTVNALRFGTMYNFRFDANTPPTTGDVTIGLFKSGSPSTVVVAASVPSAPPTPTCLRGDMNNDTLVDGLDVDLFTNLLVNGGGTPQQKCSGDLEAAPDCGIDEEDVDPFVTCVLNEGC